MQLLFPVTVLNHPSETQKVALEAKRARKLVRCKSVLKSSSLSGKLDDCSATNPEEAVIFIVEGDSAGGSTKQGRNRCFQVFLVQWFPNKFSSFATLVAEVNGCDKKNLMLY